MADSVAFPPQPSQPVESDLGGAALDNVNPMARKVSARSNAGNDVFRQRSRDSANVMKMPALDQLHTLSIRGTGTYHCRRTT